MKKIIILAGIVSLLTTTSVSALSTVEGVFNPGLSSSQFEAVLASNPVASPVAGTYTSAVSVALSASGSTSIRYTVNGTAPTCSTGLVYSSAIAVSSSQTIQALSCYPNSVSSTVSSFGYIISIPTPTPTPAPSGGGGGGGGSGGSIVSFLPTPTPSGASALFSRIDTNRDGRIDILDFNTLMVNWGRTGTGNIADFDLNGVVDIFDFNLMMVHWTR